MVISALINALDLVECIISIDAMGCQKKIVETIINNKADYVICLKVSFLGLDIQKIADAIRIYWSIENNLHWQLDVTFNEDATVKKKNAAINFSLLNKIALAAIKNDNSKGRFKGKRKRAGWNDAFLEKLLDVSF